MTIIASTFYGHQRRTNSSMTQAASVKARCLLKAPSEPLSSGATGGEVRRSCLSGRSPRVLRRPPVVSSARQSAAKQTTGSAGSPFLPTSLATQRSRPAAGPGPGQCDANQRKALGLHQRTVNPHSPPPRNNSPQPHPRPAKIRSIPLIFQRRLPGVALL